MMKETIYGKRKCLVCQKDFWATYPAQLTCSEKCRLARKKELKAINNEQRYNALWHELEWLNCQLEKTKGCKISAEVQSIQYVSEKPCISLKPDAKEKAAAFHKHKYQQFCTQCGKAFKSTDPDEKYCSEECADAAVMGGIM